MRTDIAGLIQQTPFVDTHEHICEEAHRLDPQGAGKEGNLPAPDFAMLFAGYAESDLAVAGMPPEALARLHAFDVEPMDKWRMLAPYYARTRNTGYLRCAREALRALYGEDDFREDNVLAISERVAARIRPGFYNTMLRDEANIEYCQVDAIHSAPLARETAHPELLAQDLNTMALCTDLKLDSIQALAGREAASLNDWHEIIDWAFETYGPRVVATKNQSAYNRRLDYEQVSAEDAAPLFARYLKDRESITPADDKAIQDHLFHYCVRKAVEYNLPVKLHTGYHAGHGSMRLHDVRRNVADVSGLCRAHPDARFDLFHIAYPYQDEAIALAKQYPNAYIDMCWAWIINPAVSVRFVKESLMAAPACKLFTFGGDVVLAELAVGHARIARQGLTQALTELVEERWLASDDAPGLVKRLMRGNAHEVFDHGKTLAS